MHFKKTLQKKETNRGFGLVELLVAISIMTLVSTVILTRHNAFDSAVVLRNQAYEVAFTLREAQNLAVSAAYSPDDTVSDYHQRYGVRFDRSEPRVYRIFRDNNGNGRYDSSPSEDYGAPGILDPRFSITSLENGGETVSWNTLEVMFERPNFDGIFDPDPSDGAVRIGITTESGDTRKIEVTRTGQISVLELSP